MRSRFFLFLIFTLTVFPLSLPAPAAAEEGKVERVQNYIAVIDLDVAKGLDPSLKVILTNAVIDELVKIGRFEVIDRANRDKILEEQGFQVKDCVEEKCRVDMGKLLGVGKVVTGSMNRLGETSIGMIQLVNVETGKIESSASEKCRCEPEDLLDLVRVLAGKLMGLPVSFTPKSGVFPSPPGVGEGFTPFQRGEGAKGGLYLKTDPPGAAVTLNDQRVGDTPLTLANLPAGDYQVEARKGNYYGRINVTVVRDQFTNVTVPIEEMKARLTVITEPPEARIYLDGREAGSSPATLTEVAMGTHRVEAEKKGYVRTGKDVSISRTEEMVTLNLVKGALIRVISDPSGARVEIAGLPANSTPCDYLAPPGKYRVKVSAPDYEALEYEAAVKVGEEKTLEARLKPNFGYLTVQSRPSGAAVLVDGKSLGNTPVTKEKVAWGKHQMEIRGGGNYQAQASEIEIGRGEEKQLNVALGFRPGYLSTLKPKRKVANVFTISGAGIAAAGTALAVLFKVRADSAHDSYKGASVQADLDRFRSDTESNRNVTYIGLGIVGAGVITAVIALFCRPSLPKEIKGSRVPGFEGSRVGFAPRTDQSEGRGGVYPRLGVGGHEALPYANINGGCCNDPSPSMGEGGASGSQEPTARRGEGDILGRPAFSPSGFQAFAFPGGMGAEWRF